MKKNGLITLLALTSCVAALSSCGKQDPTIKVSGLSNEVAVGSTIDLDSFVKVSGSSKSYKIYLYKDSASLVEVKGHKLTILDEGEITFLVYIDKVEVKVQLNSYYKMRLDLMQNFRGYTNKYTIQGDNDVYYHRDGYAERFFYHKSSGEYTREGYLLQNGSESAYRFSAASADNFVFDRIVSKEDFGGFNGAFGVDFTKTKKSKSLTIDGKAVECYALKDAQIIQFAQNNLIADRYSKFNASLPVDEKGAYKADGTSYGEMQVSLGAVYFTYIENVPSAVLFASINGKGVYLDTLTFSNAKSALAEDEIVVEKLSQEIEVGLPETAEHQDFFKNGLAASKNLIAEFDCDWVNSSGAHTAFPAQYKSYWIAKLPVCHTTRVLNENSIVSIVGDEIVSGVVNHGENTVYEFFSKDDGYTKRINEDYLDVYDDEYTSTSLIGREENWPSELLYLDKVVRNGTDDPSDVTKVYGFNLDKHYDLLDAICFCDDNAAKMITVFLSQGENNYAEWFEESSFKYNVTKGSYEFSFVCPLTSDGSLNYRVLFSIQPDTENAYDDQIATVISGLFA
jgi:hypothetical protein